MAEWNNPWAELRRREHIAFRLADLPDEVGAVYWPRGRRAAIIIDRGLTRQERRVALGHELAHEDLGGGCPHIDAPGWHAVVKADEKRAWDYATDRLVPPDRLAEFVNASSFFDPVTANEVADHFDVTIQVALRAMERLAS